jgi:dTDP-4-dehydrorhamnose reductase
MIILFSGAGVLLGREWVKFLGRMGLEYHAMNSKDLDITNSDAVDLTLTRVKPQAVVNCAAYTDVDGAESDMEKALRVNRNGVGHLAEWCAQNSTPIIHYSTDYVFPGRKTDLVTYPDGYPEDGETGPVNNYGKSKRAGEEVLIEAGGPYLLIRVSWLCGESGNNFVKTILKLGNERDRIQVVKDQIGSPAYAGSVVQLSHQLLQQEHKGIYHISSGGMISWFDFASEIIRLAGVSTVVEPVSASEYPAKATRPAFSKLDSSKISSTLNTEMETWDEGLAELINKLNA